MAKKQYITPAMDIARCEYNQMIAGSMGTSNNGISEIEDFEMQSNFDKGWDLW